MEQGDTIQAVRAILEKVSDPEIPVLTIGDLGIVRDVQVVDGTVTVIITPTYTGCPAMDMIAMQIRLALLEEGYRHVVINSVLSPAWTTDWMTDSGKKKLKEYGIAPPDPHFTIPADGVECPQCHSHDTRLLSLFGSTACKSLYQCNTCKEPFDFFKCH